MLMGYNYFMEITRPLRGEPLALDLLNTYWLADGQPYDLLDNAEATRHWLKENDLQSKEVVTKEVLENLRVTRDVIRRILSEESNGQNLLTFNKILHKGHRTEALEKKGPGVSYEAEAGWYVAWCAAYNFLELLRSAPQRIKKCAHPDCVLYFYDTSPKNARLWHEMATCGNRAKATRHYQRIKKVT
jgi:predicted RNA-binding Zn ribbon-like protein